MQKTLVYRKPVSYGYVVKLLDVRRHSLHSLSDTPLVFIASQPTPSPEKVCADVHRAVLDRLTKEAEREARSRHLPKRRRPWSPVRTKAPLIDTVAKRARSRPLRDHLKVAEEVAERLGAPWEPSKRGRKPSFSPKKLAAILMVKELMGLSFEALSSELKAIDYDARTEEAKERGRGAKSPCPSHLHWALKRIPEEYLERALRLIDEMVVEEHARLFGTGRLSEYSVDSTRGQVRHPRGGRGRNEDAAPPPDGEIQHTRETGDQHRGGGQGLQEHQGRETPPEARAARLNGLHGPRVRRRV